VVASVAPVSPGLMDRYLADEDKFGGGPGRQILAELGNSGNQLLGGLPFGGFEPGANGFTSAEQKTPRRGGGALLGLLQGGEIYVYLYICGSVGGRWALNAPRALGGAIWAVPGPAKKFVVLPFIGSLLRIL